MGRCMTPARPPTHAPTQPTPRPPAAQPHGAAPPKGPAFARVLAVHGPKLSERAPEAPPETQAADAPTALPQAVQPLGGEPEKHAHKHGRDDDELDPSARQAAQLAPPMTVPPRNDPAAGAAPLANARASLEDLVPQLVKRIAWSGDAQRGTVRMELGAGELSGATLTVSAEHGRVSVRVDTPPGTDVGAWRARLASRLEARGLSVESVDVR
jgi:hypothetical protein